MFFWNTTVNTGNTYWQDAIPLLFYSIRTTCELEAGVIYVTISPHSPVNQEAKRGSQEQNRAPWESTLEGVPRVLHWPLPEPHEPAIWLLSSEQVKTRWRWAPQGHRGCWLTRAMSKGPLTTMESSSLLSFYSWATGIQGDEVIFLTVIEPSNLNLGFWDSFRVLITLPFCLFCSFAHISVDYKWIFADIYRKQYVFSRNVPNNFYYVLINLLNTQDLTAK